MLKWIEERLAKRHEARISNEIVDAERQEVSAFFNRLTDMINRDSLPTRCQAVYETIAKWAQGNDERIKQAALFLFMWEIEEKRHAFWEISDIASEIRAAQ